MTTRLDSRDFDLELGEHDKYEMGPAVDHIRYGDKFIDEYTTEELRAAYIEHLGPCRVCQKMGSRHADAQTREDLIGIWTRDRSLQEYRPTVNASLDNIARAGACEVCCKLATDTRTAASRDADIKRRRRKLKAKKIIPKEFSKCSFDDSDESIMMRNAEIWEEARAWTPDRESWWIYGDKGAGKTFMARCMLNAQLDQGVSVGEISGVKFDAMAKRRFYEWHEQREMFGLVQVLLIEDIDKAVWTPEGMAELYSLLDERCSNERRTMVTTNGTVERVLQIFNTSTRNESLAGTIIDRFQPIRRIHIVGDTLRTSTIKGEDHE